MITTQCTNRGGQPSASPNTYTTAPLPTWVTLGDFQGLLCRLLSLGKSCYTAIYIDHLPMIEILVPRLWATTSWMFLGRALWHWVTKFDLKMQSMCVCVPTPKLNQHILSKCSSICRRDTLLYAVLHRIYFLSGSLGNLLKRGSAVTEQTDMVICGLRVMCTIRT